MGLRKKVAHKLQCFFVIEPPIESFIEMSHIRPSQLGIVSEDNCFSNTHSKLNHVHKIVENKFIYIQLTAILIIIHCRKWLFQFRQIFVCCKNAKQAVIYVAGNLHLLLSTN